MTGTRQIRGDISSQTCGGIATGEIACLTVNSFNYCEYGQLASNDPQHCAEGTVCCPSQRQCSFVENCLDFLAPSPPLLQTTSIESTSKKKLVAHPLNFAPAVPAYVPPVTDTIASQGIAQGLTLHPTSASNTLPSASPLSVAAYNNPALPTTNTQIAATTGNTANKATITFASQTASASPLAASPNVVISQVSVSVDVTPRPSPISSNLIGSSTSPSAYNASGISAQDQSNSITSTNSNVVKIASALGILGILVICIAGFVYWRRWKQPGDSLNEESFLPEVKGVDGITSGNFHQPPQSNIPEIGSGGVSHMLSQDNTAQEFYRDSTGSLRATSGPSDRFISSPVFVFPASPSAGSPANFKSGGALSNGKKTNFSQMMSSTMSADSIMKYNSSNQSFSNGGDSELHKSIFSKNSLLQASSKLSDHEQNDQALTSGGGDVWNLISSYGTDSVGAAYSSPRALESGPSFAESVQKGFSGIYGRYANTQINEEVVDLNGSTASLEKETNIAQGDRIYDLDQRDAEDLNYNIESTDRMFDATGLSSHDSLNEADNELQGVSSLGDNSDSNSELESVEETGNLKTVQEQETDHLVRAKVPPANIPPQIVIGQRLPAWLTNDDDESGRNSLCTPKTEPKPIWRISKTAADTNDTRASQGESLPESVNKPRESIKNKRISHSVASRSSPSGGDFSPKQVKIVPFTPNSPSKPTGSSKVFKAFETTKESNQPTHVSREQFFGTRSDELAMGAGDLIHVDRVYEDGWCCVINLSQGKKVGMVPMQLLKEVKGGIGPSKRVVRVVKDQEDEGKIKETGRGDNVVWVGALSPSDKRKSTDSTSSFTGGRRINPRVDSL